jgi:rod shape determining protein RodA
VKYFSSLFKKLSKVPFTIVFLVTLVACFGFLMMYSAAQGHIYPWAARQMIHFAIFMPLMILISLIDLRFWYKSSYLFYYIALFLLLFVHLLGYTAMGATRWINLGIIKLQPSELMKICIVFALARYFHDLNNKEITLKYLIIPTIMLIFPAALIIKQPDLGTGLILLMLGVMLFFVAGVKRWVFVTGFIGVSIALPIIWQFLHDYQKNRILTFFNPERDPLGSSYNVIQSKIAIGSGGFFGKGFLKGSQSQLQFLPEHQTDFIFTMLCEEWGMLGGMLLLTVFAILIFYCYIIGINARSKFGNLLALGITSMFFLHVFINIGMVMGLLPAVGVPLPLLSYGGTMMMTILIGFGLVMSVHIHSKHTINNALKKFF